MVTIRLGKSKNLKTCLYSAFLSKKDMPQKLSNAINQLRLCNTTKNEYEIALTTVVGIINRFPDVHFSITSKVREDFIDWEEFPTDMKFKDKPFYNQAEAILYGLNYKDSFILGDQQGLGKTMSAIQLAIGRKIKYGIKHCLIICGINSTKWNWKEEIEKHSDEKCWVLGTRYTKTKPYRLKASTFEDKMYDLKNLPDDFFVVLNIESLRLHEYRDGRELKYPMVDLINHLCELGAIGMIVFDECHVCKNPTSKQGKSLLKLNRCRYKLPMSGTVQQNNPLDCYTPLAWIGAEKNSFYQFKRHYCKFGGWGGTEVVGFKNLGELKAKMANNMLRNLKSDILDMPPKVHTNVYCEMQKDQQKVYNAVLDKLRQEIDKIRLSNDPLAEIIRLRQATGNPDILTYSDVSCAKYDRMVDHIEEIVASGEKVIVFSQWAKVAEEACIRLSKYNPIYIDGNVDPKDRIDLVNTFQKNPNRAVIVGTIGAMGTGLTLNAASNVIFLDEPWNYAIKEQAEDRAHRIGTSGIVTIFTYITKNTIDERIHAIVQSKKRLSDFVVDGKKVDMAQYLLS